MFDLIPAAHAVRSSRISSLRSHPSRGGGAMSRRDPSSSQVKALAHYGQAASQLLKFSPSKPAPPRRCPRPRLGEIGRRRRDNPGLLAEHHAERRRSFRWQETVLMITGLLTSFLWPLILVARGLCVAAFSCGGRFSACNRSRLKSPSCRFPFGLSARVGDQICGPVGARRPHAGAGSLRQNGAPFQRSAAGLAFAMKIRTRSSPSRIE